MHGQINRRSDLILASAYILSLELKANYFVFRLSAMKSGRPCGVTSASSSCRAPRGSALWEGQPRGGSGITLSCDSGHMMAGGTWPFSWVSGNFCFVLFFILEKEMSSRAKVQFGLRQNRMSPNCFSFWSERDNQKSILDEYCLLLGSAPWCRQNQTKRMRLIPLWDQTQVTQWTCRPSWDPHSLRYPAIMNKCTWHQLVTGTNQK